MGQATYDLVEWQKIIFPFKPEWMANPEEIQEFYGFTHKDDVYSEQGKRILRDCSMYSLLNLGDSPIWMCCSMKDGEPENRGHLLHHPKHVQVIKKRGDEAGVKVEAHYTDLDGNAWQKATEFLLKHLK